MRDDTPRQLELIGGQDVEVIEPERPEPATGTRAPEPGVRGCWALNVRGDPCAAPRRSDGDYCNAHSGIGVASDPARFALLGGDAKRERAQTRAAMRLIFGSHRTWTPRGALRAAATVNAGAMAARVIDATLDPKLEPERAARLVLDVLTEVDPQATVTLERTLPGSVDGLEGATLAELLEYAESAKTPSPSP